MRHSFHLRGHEGRQIATKRRRYLTWIFVLIFGTAGAAVAQPPAAPFVEQPPISQVELDAVVAICGDFDLDGDLDVVSASHYGGEIIWHENSQGDASAWIRRPIWEDSRGASSLAVADIDGDGDLDVAVAASYRNEVAWFENPGTLTSSWEPHTLPGLNLNVTGVAAGDVDGDGDVDLAIAEMNGLYWYENDGGDSTTWPRRVVSQQYESTQTVVLGDLDGDQDLDVVAGTRRNTRVAWVENIPGLVTTWQPSEIHRSPSEETDVAIADIDNDGDMDTVSIAGTSGELVWHENLDRSGSKWQTSTIEDGTKDTHSRGFGPYPRRRITTADIDNDGDIDVLSSSIYDDRLALHENLSNGDWTTRIIVSQSLFPSNITTCDLDGDGDLDVIDTSLTVDFNGFIRWYANQSTRE
ncbi:MAG: FG-GAP-like repeat-containing protein [Acidobacteriota bacterium]